MTSVKRFFSFETKVVQLGTRGFSPEGVMNLRGGVDDGMGVCVGWGKTLPPEVKCLERAIEIKLPLPVSESDLPGSILLESCRLYAVKPIRRRAVGCFFGYETR